MKEGSRKAVALSLVFIVSALLVLATWSNLVPFGSFPEREIGEDGIDVTYREALEQYGLDDGEIERVMEDRPEGFGNQSIGQDLLTLATEETGAANAVTGILWDFRGYDTLGEATVIFVAVAGVAALFRTSRKEEE